MKFSEFAAHLKKINKRKHAILLDGLQTVADVVVDTAQDYCTPGKSPYDPMIFPSKPPGTTGAPYRTGLMRDTIQGNVADTGRGKASAVIWSDAEYSSYVHDGTSKMQARPFITDAVKANESRIEEIMIDAARRTFEGEP